MADTLPLDYVPSSPTGPSGGRLAIEAGRVAVLRKGVFGSRAAMARPREDLRGYESGTAQELAERGWMSAGAQLALQRAATVDPETPFLAIRFEDAMGSNDVWLFRGPPEQMDLAIGALSSGGVVAGPASSRGDAADRPRSQDYVDPAVLEELSQGRRRRTAPARGAAGVVVLGLLATGGYVAFQVVPDVVDEIQRGFEIPSIPTPTISLPEIPLPPDGPGQDEEDARPFSVAQALRGLGSPSVDRAGVTQAGRQRRNGRAVIIPLRSGGRPLQLIVFPDPQRARAAKRTRDFLLANLLLRGQGAASVAPIVFVAVASPQEPVI